MTLSYEDAVVQALDALAAASAQKAFPARLSSSFRRELEAELRAVRSGQLSPRSVAVSLTHQVVDSGHADEGFERALTRMYELQGSAPGTLTLLARVTVRQLREAGIGTLEAASSLVARHGVLVPTVEEHGTSRLITITVHGRPMIPAFSSRELFDAWVSESKEAGVIASVVPATGVGQLAPGVDVVINPLNEHMVLRNA
ncbi:SseB family protein [Psychromicrobium xiongbiense]|uniref:SseB family protein n=1 Tax=Psychromicrobium xiongbiense TaxID=3051184 RepID=UPI0025545876|nr:SseB family protein [Psychromicrobium sp. YIM S02556]